MLIRVFLRGGADTLSLLVPKGDDAYFRARPSLAIRGSIDLDGFYGLHPSAVALYPLFREGRLAFVQAVGCEDASGSHFVVQDRVERGESAEEKASGGWLARALRAKDTRGPLSSVAIGDRIPEALRGAPQATAMRAVSELSLRIPGGSEPARRALRELYRGDALLGEPALATLEVLDRLEPARPEIAPQRADDDFTTGVREIARLARAEVGLEVACLDVDGWDTHFAESSLFPERARTLATGLAALTRAVPEATIVVVTEFGRRSYENGSGGTDHGRGWAMTLLGARVRGGKIYGAWPGLAEETIEGPGGLAVRVDYRAALAEVLTGLAIDPRQVFAVAPSALGLMS